MEESDSSAIGRPLGAIQDDVVALAAAEGTLHVVQNRSSIVTVSVGAFVLVLEPRAARELGYALLNTFAGDVGDLPADSWMRYGLDELLGVAGPPRRRAATIDGRGVLCLVGEPEVSLTAHLVPHLGNRGPRLSEDSSDQIAEGGICFSIPLWCENSDLAGDVGAIELTAVDGVNCMTVVDWPDAGQEVLARVRRLLLDHETPE